MIINCAHCGKQIDKPAAYVNRARAIGAPQFCNKKCFGLSRRCNRTSEENKIIKQEYDKKRRNQLADVLKAKQKAYNESPAGRAMQKRQREKRKEFHKEYVRTERYRKWKHDYDKVHVAKTKYGEFYESAILLNKIETIILPERLEAKIQNGLLNKSQKRKRLWNSQQKI